MGKITVTEQATNPDTPASGKRTLFSKDDGWYEKDDQGNVTKLQGDPDAIHDNVSGEINAVTAKSTPVLADIILIEDSESSYVKKKITLSDIPAVDWEDNGDGGLTPVGNKEVSVGRPESGRELVAGGGDSYTGTSKVLVYSFNGSSFTDETSKIVSNDDTRLSFPNNSVNTAIYLASKLNNGSDYITHTGVKLEIDTAAVLGTGDIAFEFWNGSSWEEFNHQSTNSDAPYLPYANEKFEQTGSYQYLYSEAIRQTWAKNDPMSLGTTYFWVRWRITGTIITTPEFDRIKLHSDRFEANRDGFTAYYGRSRALKKMHLGWGNFQGASSSPSDQEIYLSDNLDVGMIENAFQSNAVDRIGYKSFLPLDICTACPLKLTFAFFGDSNEVEHNVDFTVRWGLLQPNGKVYKTSTNAPTTVTGEQSINGSYPMPLNSVNTVQYVSLELDLSEAIPERASSAGDILFLSFERQGSTDAYTGAIIMVEVEAFYSSWKRGGHLS